MTPILIYYTHKHMIAYCLYIVFTYTW